MKIAVWQKNLYILWFSQVISLMGFGLGLPFIPYYIQDLGVTDPDSIKFYSGLLSALPGFTMGLMAPVWGYFADRIGRKFILLRAVFFGIFVLAGMGLSQTVGHLIIFRILQGVLTGTVTASYALVASSTPDERMSYALGFMASSNFIGFSIGPFLGGMMAEAYGYRVGFLIGACMMAVNFLLVLIAVKEQDKPQGFIKTRQIGTHPSTSHKKNRRIGTYVVILLFMVFVVKMGSTIAHPYLSLFVQEVRGTMEGSAAVTGTISGLVGLMTALAGVTLSRLGDRFDKNRLVIRYLIGSIVFSAPLFFLPSLTIFAIVYCAVFFMIGGVEPILMSMMSESTPKEKRGFSFGIFSLIGNMGWALSPIVGSGITIAFGLRALYLFLPVFFILSLLTALFLYHKRSMHPMQQ